jgi:alcohol dehydrogenase class IV
LVLDPHQAIEGGIEFVSELVERLEIPHLGSFGLSQANIAELIGPARRASSMRYNPVVLSDDALTDILHKAL